MFARLCAHRRFILPFVVLLLCLVIPSNVRSVEPEGEPISVVVLSFGNRDQPSFAQFVEAFRAGIEQQHHAPLQIYLETLDEYRAVNDPSSVKAMDQYLANKYKGQSLDLVVAVGNRSLDFLLPRREKLFPGAKLLYSTVFREAVPDATGVILELNLLPTIDVALKQNPDTKRLLLITGSSPADQTGIVPLVAALEEQFRRQGRAIEIETLPRTTYDKARRYLSGLPPHTVCIFLFYYMDSAGQVFTPSRVLPVFSRLSTRPIYSGWDIDVGRGSVGGRVIVIEDVGHALALLALRVLSGEEPGDIPPVRGEFQRYMFDWRQLKRWGIRLDQLPSDSIVLHREYTTWELYKWHIVGGIGLILGQTGLILFLFRLWVIKTRAQRELAATLEHMHALSGRLIRAQEEERMRIARELHDDFSQRLALLSIELEEVGRQPAPPSPASGKQLQDLWQQTRDIGTDIHRLSHQLHPSQLEALGLVPAVRSFCADLAKQKRLHIEFECQGIPQEPAPEVALCLYRIAQEGLQNVSKHSGASRARVTLTGGHETLDLTVTDDGIGFDPDSLGTSPGLGLVSMRERVRLLHGDFSIQSEPGHGTRLEARIPLNRPSA